MNKVIKNSKQFKGLPPGRYTVIGEAAEKLLAQGTLYRRCFRHYERIGQIEEKQPSWQWPEGWWGTVCLLRERPQPIGDSNV